MFDVYLNDRRDLRVVRQGISNTAHWSVGEMAEKKRRAVSVSDEIRLAAQRQVYYVRKQRDLLKDQIEVGNSRSGFRTPMRSLRMAEGSTTPRSQRLCHCGRDR